MNFLSFLIFWGPVAGWAGVIYYLSSIPSLNSGLGVWDFVLRKIAHVMEYAILMLLSVRASRRSWPEKSLRKITLWCAFAGILYAVSDEYHQSFVPGRGPSAMDVAVDGIGILLVVAGRRFFYRAAVVVLPLLFLGCSADARMKKAAKLEQKGKPYEAWQLYQNIAAQYPKHPRAPEALFRAGWLVQNQRKDCAMAGVFYDAVMERYPQSDPWGSLAANQKDNCPDYFPLLAGFEWVEGDSDTKGKNARIETVCKAAPEKGELPSEAGTLVRTYYAGASKFKATETTYKKIKGELSEFATEISARPKVIMQLPAQEGNKWKTRVSDRVLTYEIAAVNKTVVVAAGQFTDCLWVRSSVDGVPGTTNEYYAPFVGRVLTSFTTPTGEKRNTELLSYKAAPLPPP